MITNHIGCVIVCMLASCDVDRGFKPCMGKAKDL